MTFKDDVSSIRTSPPGRVRWSAQARVGGGVVACVACIVGFLALSVGWLRHASGSVPAGALLVSTGDARIIAWALAWVAHALVTDPSRLFDANINHPAPAQLTGSEHFLSTQLVFAPTFALTGNALLAANVIAIASYPLSAIAMRQLLIALHLTPGPAFLGGLVFAIGPLLVPGNVQVLQYLPFYLPVAALLVTRLRRSRTLHDAILLAMVLAMAFLSSYYAAVLVLVASVIWLAFELGRAGEGRLRFAMLSTAAIGAAGTILLVASLPYFTRAEAAEADPVALMARGNELYAGYLAMPGVREIIQGLVDAGVLGQGFDPARLSDPRFIAQVTLVTLSLTPRSFGGVLLAAASAGAVSGLSAREPVRTICLRGVVLVMVGGVLMVGPALYLGEQRVQLPYALIALSPLRFFRFPFRFVILIGFGTALLAAAFFEWSMGRVRGWWRRVVFVTLLVVLLATRGRELPPPAYEPVPAQSAPVYETLRQLADREGPGPVLELPLRSVLGAPLEWDAMIGSTRHWLPLVTGLTGYPPPHRKRLDLAIGRLPAPGALDAIVATTGACWLLLHPRDAWPTPSVRDELLRSDRVSIRATVDGWVVAQLGAAGGDS